MYNEKLDKLIEMALMDGELTEKEKQVLFKNAETIGVDLDEFEMVLESKLFEKQKSMEQEKTIDVAPKSNKKGDLKKCPSCGSPVKSFIAKCNDCDHEFRNIEVNSSVNELLNELKKIRKSKFKDEDGDFEEDEYFEARAEAIRNFAIPTSKEDLIEFATKGMSEFDSKKIDNEELNSAWESKTEEAISKLHVFALNDKSIVPIIENFEKKFTEKLKKHRKVKRNETIMLAIGFPCVFFIGYLMYAFIFSLIGYHYWPF